MRTLRLYMWKEWREHRGPLLALAALLGLLVLGAAHWTPRKTFGDPIVLAVCVSLTVFAVLLQAGELMTPESGGARRRFLERIPRGTERAFLAKSVFFVILLALAAAYGWGLGMLASWWRTGATPTWGAERVALRLLAPTVMVGLWTFAVSSWVPRGSLALPVALLLLGTVFAPFGYLIEVRGYEIQKREAFVFMALTALGALVVGAVSFLRGRRHGRPGWFALFTGLLLGVPFLAPIPAWAAVRYASCNEISPGSEGFGVLFVWPCQDERHAVVAALQHRPWLSEPVQSVLVVDLENGLWERPVETSCRIVGTRGEFDLHPTRLSIGNMENAPLLAIDLKAGTVVDFDPGIDFGYTPTAGLGLRYRGAGGERFHDATRDRTFTEQELPVLEVGTEVLIRPGNWLLRQDSSDLEGLERPWSSLDPETGGMRALDWPAGDNYTWPMLPDGRVFLCIEGDVFLGDSDGELTRLPSTRKISPWLGNGYLGQEVFRDAQTVILGDSVGYFRFDEASLTLEPLPFDSRKEFILRAYDDGSFLLLEEEGRIVRARGDGSSRTLFPLD